MSDSRKSPALSTGSRGKVLVITGPTATGKTALGVELALEFGGEVISADSMQIYRGMDIGTAKASPLEMRGVPHHMLDVADPRESWSVSRYVQEADPVVKDVLARGKLPIIVGGTGLYIDSLISGRSFAGGEPSPELRNELNEKYDHIGGAAMLEELRMADPERAQKLHPADKKRIVRALEVFISTGRTITEHDEETKRLPPKYDAATVMLSYREREDLYDRIDRRVDDMISGGLFEEVRRLLDSGVPRESTAMQAIGYKEVVLALESKITPQEAVELIKRESRRYAKRQLTWLRDKKDLCAVLWDRSPDFDFARQSLTDYFAAHGLE